MVRRSRITFSGNSPRWYKASIIGFLINALVLWTVGQSQPVGCLCWNSSSPWPWRSRVLSADASGLLLIEALLLKMTTPQALYDELLHNFPVILLLMFMVAGIYFMKDLLLFLFSRLLLGFRSKALLALMFCFLSAFLSAFLDDALTVTAVIIRCGHGVLFGLSPRRFGQ